MASRVVMACDHGGLDRKNELKAWLLNERYEVNDLGVHDEKSVDYPDRAELACREFLNDGGYAFGVLLCGTGIGISISANKIPGIRCGLPQDIFAARMAREHNNCQFIAFGGRIDYKESITEMLRAFCEASFAEEERHVRRVNKIIALDAALSKEL
jgi:ribose 5-phosphate isomerase B